MTTIAVRGGCAALLGAMMWAPVAFAYPMYDDGTGVGCVSCHDQFQGGTGVLHFQHRTQLGITTCNLCHPDGAGSTPVRTYWSGPGGGFGCAGCHGQDYGETSPNSGEPKATAYGLRQFHVNLGYTQCSTSGCHKPGQLGHPDPFPPLYPENVAPPYYDPAYSDLTDPCSSAQEDMPLDPDSVGLDNDGDGLVDRDDPDCPATTTSTTIMSTTTTTTLPLACGATPADGCVAPTKGVLLVNEKTPGKEKLKVALKKLQVAVMPSQLGDPVMGTTAYKVCIYDGSNQLSGEYTVAKAGEICGDRSCWSAITGKGYKYRDKAFTADGILKINAFGGDAGKGKVVVVGKNNASTLPTGVAAALQDTTSATVQVLTSDASCFGVSLTVKKADGTIFSGVGP